MKTIYIIRHAKSSWADPEKSDKARPLNDRGKRDAPRMAKRLKEKGIHPDLMVSSPAKRAYATSKRMAKVLGYNKDDIAKEESLYEAHEDAILNVIQHLKDKHSTIMIFGHNPGLTDFVNSFMSEEQEIDNIPTCGVVAFQSDAESWKQVTWGTGRIQFFDYPKSRED